MFDRNNRPKAGNLLKIGKGFVKSGSESWARLSNTEQTIAERNGIHFFHDGDMFVVTPSNPSQYAENFVRSAMAPETMVAEVAQKTVWKIAKAHSGTPAGRIWL